jgi:carboxylesterase
VTAAERNMPGAGPVAIDRGRPRACLLLHGWLTCPADFGELPAALDRAGWDVCAPLLPGHGTAPQDLDGVTADELIAAARSHYQALHDGHSQVALGGFSMGGTLSTVLAAERAPSRLVLIAPYYAVTHKWYYLLPVPWWVRVIPPVVGHVTGSRRWIRINDRARVDRIVCYRRFAVSSVRELMKVRSAAVARADLRGMTMPTLLVYSCGDEVASPRAMRRFFERLPARSKRELVFTRSNHHVLHDYDREEAVKGIVEFVSSGGRQSCP